jgi:L-ascorbate metabolism protein UlaG (beta-lactamase superfamily)
MKKTLLSIIAFALLAPWPVSCSKDDTPSKKTCTAAPVVSSGADQTISGTPSADLVGTTDSGTGAWTIVSGSGGSIVAGSTAKLSGVTGSTYKLKFEATNDCGTSADEVTIEFVSCGSVQTPEQMAANMHWIEQAGFRIETSAFTIYTDPISITQKDTADIVMISHAHGDHFTAGDLGKITGPNTILIAPADVVYSGTIGTRVVLEPGGTYSAFNGCVEIKAVPAYNITKTQYHDKSKKWVGYVVTVDGVTFYHTGDTERVPEMKDITTDIILLPLGQTYTFNTVEDAVAAVKDTKAKIAIPMHFGLYEGTVQDATKFKDLLKDELTVIIKVKGE